MEESAEKKNGFFSNWIVKNLIGAFLFFAVLLTVTTIALNQLTHHGMSIEVPDLTSMSVVRLPERPQKGT